MKRIWKNLIPLIFIMFFSIFSYGQGNQSTGQKQLNMSLGIGFPELLNIGLRYQIDQTQIGISYGSISADGISVSGDVYYHFGGFSKLSYRRPHYQRIGLIYYREETESSIDKYLFLNLRVGSDINISRKVGIEIDAGILIKLSEEEIEKKPSWDLVTVPTVLPCIGIGVFYRIY